MIHRKQDEDLRGLKKLTQLRKINTFQPDINN